MLDEDGRVVRPDNYRLAHAAAWDAGNRAMRRAGRQRWTPAERRIAAATMGRLLRALAEPQP